MSLVALLGSGRSSWSRCWCCTATCGGGWSAARRAQGPPDGGRLFERVVEIVNAQRPDVVALVGDLVDGSVEELRQDVAPLADLVSEQGVFFVTGNHECFVDTLAWLRHLPTLGVQVLHNERVPVRRGGPAAVRTHARRSALAFDHVVRLDQPAVEGLSRHGDTQLYVTAGAGYWGPPMRVGATPEVTVVELRAAGG
jgi:hypothetical protein